MKVKIHISFVNLTVANCSKTIRKLCSKHTKLKKIMKIILFTLLILNIKTRTACKYINVLSNANL